MANFAQGKNSVVSINGATLAFTDYTAADTGDNQDTTNFENNGFKTSLIGIMVLNMTLAGYWDLSELPTGPPGLYVRDDLPNINLFPDSGGGGYSMALATVNSANNSSNVRGLVQFNASMESNGFYSVP